MTDTYEENVAHFPYLLRGDTLPQLAACRPENEPDRPLGLLWGVDVSHLTTKKQARCVWHQVKDDLKAAMWENPSIKHVCIAAVRPRRLPYSVFLKIPGGFARHLHNDLERDRAKYVQVLMLDVTDCDQPVLLHQRLIEVFNLPSGSWDGINLTWDEIAEYGVEEAWGRSFL